MFEIAIFLSCHQYDFHSEDLELGVRPCCAFLSPWVQREFCSYVYFCCRFVFDPLLFCQFCS